MKEIEEECRKRENEEDEMVVKRKMNEYRF